MQVRTNKKSTANRLCPCIVAVSAQVCAPPCLACTDTTARFTPVAAHRVLRHGAGMLPPPNPLRLSRLLLRALPAILGISVLQATYIGPVHAQVYRCLDAQGRTSYTSLPCPNAQREKQILPALTPEEQARQTAAYEAALQRRQAEREALAQRQTAQPAQAPSSPSSIEDPSPPAAPAPVVVPPSPYGYPPAHRPPAHMRPPQRPMPPPTPSEGYNCNVFRCYDGKGNTWSRP